MLWTFSNRWAIRRPEPGRVAARSDDSETIGLCKKSEGFTAPRRPGGAGRDLRLPAAWVLLVAALPVFAADRDPGPPHKEMLRMLDFLKEMEMLGEIEIMQELPLLEGASGVTLRGPRKGSAPRVKEPLK